MSDSGPVDAGHDAAGSLRERPGTNVPDRTPVVERGHIGAVPAFWGDDEDGPFTAALIFRVGEADERLRTRGRCHLLRALVLDGLETGASEVTVSVTTLRTTFTVTGTEEAVASTMTSITRRLTALRTDRTDALVPGIVDEWRRPEQWDTDLMSLRFGSRGYGLPTLPLVGLSDIDVPAFDEWVRNWFTADNAALSANRRPPVSFDLGALGDGIPKPLPPPHQLERDYPVAAVGRPGRLAVSFLSRFDATAAMMYDLVIDRIRARCTAIDPTIGPPRTVTRRTGPGLATLGMSIEAPDESIGALRDAISSELFALSMTGPTTDELDRARIALRRARHHPGADRHRQVRQTAIDHLFGEDTAADRALRADPAELAKVVRDALPRAIWLLPPAVPVTDHRLGAVAGVLRAEPTGETWLPGPESSNRGSSHLVVSPETVARVLGDRVTAAVDFTDLVAYEIHSDGCRTLWSVDGTTIVIDPTDWIGGETIAGRIDPYAEPWIVLHSTTEPHTDGK